VLAEERQHAAVVVRVARDVGEQRAACADRIGAGADDSGVAAL